MVAQPLQPVEPVVRGDPRRSGRSPPGTHGRDHGPDRSRLAFSNYGARIDAQGWGREVTTTGGFWDRAGDLQGGAEEIAWYTDTFSGTSSASPVVVGALACLQGILRAAQLVAMSPEQARDVLRRTGSPQQDAPGRPASQRIGNRPDIKAAVTHLIPASVGSGQAERYWDELLPYPRELPPRMRLFVAGAWRNLNHPAPDIRQAVHAAFAGDGRTFASGTRTTRWWAWSSLDEPPDQPPEEIEREGEHRMSTTPQMNPSTMSQQYGQQQYAQQGASTAPPQMGLQSQQSHIPLAQEMQQLSQQQPYQHLLQQLAGQQHQQQQPLVLPGAVDSQAITSGIATKFWDVVTPLPGQPSILYLFINNGWRRLVNPNAVTHDEVQEAFAFGQQVIGIYESTNDVIQAVIVNKQ